MSRIKNNNNNNTNNPHTILHPHFQHASFQSKNFFISLFSLCLENRELTVVIWNTPNFWSVNYVFHYYAYACRSLVFIPASVTRFSWILENTFVQILWVWHKHAQYAVRFAWELHFLMCTKVVYLRFIKCLLYPPTIYPCDLGILFQHFMWMP